MAKIEKFESSVITFDTFLSHNSHDKPAVQRLAALLRERRFRVWLDEEQLVPGRLWQPLLEKGIQQSKTGAVLFGADGMGPWENEEMRSLLQQAVNEGKSVIPVILPGAPDRPELPMFLRTRTWVDLRDGFTDSGIDLLSWGIRGEKPPHATPTAAVYSRNPFIVGVPIRNPNDFFGRKRERRFCFDRLRGMQSVSIIGERRIGKSSLLHYISCKATDELGPSYRGVYIDLLSSRARTLVGLLAAIQRQLGLTDLAATLADFEERMEKVSGCGLRPIVALDELDLFARYPQEFSQDFFEMLRALGSAGKLALVTASKLGLRELHDQGALVSPLFNIMGIQKLGPFVEGEDIEFVTALREEAAFTDKQALAIIHRGRRHPLRLQVLCSHAFAGNAESEVDLARLLEDAEAEILAILGA